MIFRKKVNEIQEAIDKDNSGCFFNSAIEYLLEKKEDFVSDNYSYNKDKTAGWREMVDNAEKNIDIITDVFSFMYIRCFTEIRIQDINGRFGREYVKKMLIDIAERFK